MLKVKQFGGTCTTNVINKPSNPICQEKHVFVAILIQLFYWNVCCFSCLFNRRIVWAVEYLKAVLGIEAVDQQGFVMVVGNHSIYRDVFLDRFSHNLETLFRGVNIFLVIVILKSRLPFPWLYLMSSVYMNWMNFSLTKFTVTIVLPCFKSSPHGYFSSPSKLFSWYYYLKGGVSCEYFNKKSIKKKYEEK